MIVYNITIRKSATLVTATVTQTQSTHIVTIPSLVTVSTTALTRCMTVTMEACKKVQKE